MRRTVAVWLVALGLAVGGCADGGASNDEADTSSATTAVEVTTSTSAAPASTVMPAAEPPVTEEAVAEPVEEEVVSVPPAAEPAVGAEPVAAPPVTSEGGDRPRTERQLNPFNCVGEICPNPYPDAPAPDPNADPLNPQIVWCGTDKHVHDRGATVYSNGDWTPWTPHCADMFDAVNNPPGTTGGGGAVAGPCHPDEEGMTTHTADMRKQQCTGGQWVFIH